MAKDKNPTVDDYNEILLFYNELSSRCSKRELHLLVQNLAYSLVNAWSKKSVRAMARMIRENPVGE